MKRLFMLLSAGLLLTACDSPLVPNGYSLLSDTLTLRVPTDSVDAPSALDLQVVNRVLGGVRSPEKAEDAEQWDLVLRRRDGALYLVPASAIGLSSRAAISQPITGRSFEDIASAREFARDSAAALVLGNAAYVAQSRALKATIEDPVGCSNYAKIRPLRIDEAQGEVTFEVVANPNCNDAALR